MDEDNNEIAAEWIVRAQLKIHNPRAKASSFDASDCCGGASAKRSTDSPCRVVYNWHSDEAKDRAGAAASRRTKTLPTTTSEKLVVECDPNQPTSLDEACTSTCHITLTTDLCPSRLMESARNGCVTHTYTFSPDQSQAVLKKVQKTTLIDACCQTSDIESTRGSSRKISSRSSSNERRRRFLSDQAASRRSRSEGRLLKPSQQQPTSVPAAAATAVRQPSPAISNHSPKSSSKEKKKPPRTVHIDVYCTGSEVETSSSNSSSPNIADDLANIMDRDELANLMAQMTVIERNDMVLKHRRVTSKGELPRKLATTNGERGGQ